MDERIQIALVVSGLLCAVWISRKINIWRIKRTYLSIMSDLEKRGAVDFRSAVALPYEKQSILKFGMKDYRPKALEFLVANGVVGKTGDGKYYLRDTSGSNSSFSPF